MPPRSSSFSLDCSLMAHTRKNDNYARTNYQNDDDCAKLYTVLATLIVYDAYLFFTTTGKQKNYGYTKLQFVCTEKSCDRIFIQCYLCY